MFPRSPPSPTVSRAVSFVVPDVADLRSPFEVSPLPADIEPPSRLDDRASSPYDGVRALRWPAALRTNDAPPALPGAPVGSLGRADWLTAAVHDGPSSGHAGQARYERLFWESACAIARGVQQSIHVHGDGAHHEGAVAEIPGISAMWLTAMNARSRMAVACEDFFFDTSLRDPSSPHLRMKTPMIEQYEPQVRSVIDHLVRSDPPTTAEFSLVMRSSEATDRAFGIECPAIALYHVDIGLRDRSGQPGRLTSTVIPADRGVERRLSDPMIDYSKVMSHTAAERIPELMERAHERAARALDPSISSGEAREHVASFMWTLYHACPSTRGSAAMTDLCANALYLARGDQPHTWPKGVVGDIEALLRSEPMWIEHYLAIGFEPTATRESPRASTLEASLRRQLIGSAPSASSEGRTAAS
jgi:hypothetical protein